MCFVTVNIAVSAAEILESKGVSVRLLDMHTIKPLDMEAVTECLVNIGKVIAVEDAYIINGLSSASASRTGSASPALTRNCWRSTVLLRKISSRQPKNSSAEPNRLTSRFIVNHIV